MGQVHINSISRHPLHCCMEIWRPLDFMQLLYPDLQNHCLNSLKTWYTSSLQYFPSYFLPYFQIQWVGPIHFSLEPVSKELPLWIFLPLMNIIQNGPSLSWSPPPPKKPSTRLELFWHVPFEAYDISIINPIGWGEMIEVYVICRLRERDICI